MKTQVAQIRKRSPVLAILAASFSLLASAIWLATALTHRHARPVKGLPATPSAEFWIPAAFLCSGILWLFIGLRWRREQRG